LKLRIFVQPNAKKNEVIGMHGEAVKIKIKALPVDGEANKAVVAFLSEILSIPRSGIRISHGESSRKKTVEIQTDETEIQIIEKLLKK
jgi:uncharacterized protein (TIGR00251 family)